ncbi:MAG: nucleotidyltransferase [Nitrospinae bacterium]|nr:nucleotidyltransferase [Nitrospinota bacterium]
MKYKNVFHLISNLVNKNNISCILIGGFAVNYYQLTRQTADVDFLITRESYDVIAKGLKNTGYKVMSNAENFIQVHSSNPKYMDVDFMFVSQNTMNKILKECEEVTIGNMVFWVPSLMHLIALKLHSIKYNEKVRMYRDLPDIINLIKINEIDVHDKGFKRLCLEHGTETIYQRVIEAFL